MYQQSDDEVLTKITCMQNSSIVPADLTDYSLHNNILHHLTVTTLISILYEKLPMRILLKLSKRWRNSLIVDMLKHLSLPWAELSLLQRVPSSSGQLTKLGKNSFYSLVPIVDRVSDDCFYYFHNILSLNYLYIF